MRRHAETSDPTLQETLNMLVSAGEFAADGKRGL
jgi:hypothetical protein